MTLSILPRGLFYILTLIHILPLHSSKELIRITEISEKLSDYPPLGPKMLTRHLQQNGTTPQEESFKTIPSPCKKRPGPKSKPPSLYNHSVILRAHPIPMDPSPRCVPITGPK